MFSDMIKHSFELWRKRHWLTYINKSVDKYYKYDSKARREAHCVRELVKRYNEEYPDDKIADGRWKD